MANQVEGRSEVRLVPMSAEWIERLQGLDEQLVRDVTRAYHEEGMAEEAVRDAMVSHSLLKQTLISDFVNDGQGDVHGPHLAEAEVWARIDELEALAAFDKEEEGQ